MVGLNLNVLQALILHFPEKACVGCQIREKHRFEMERVVAFGRVVLRNAVR